MKTKNENDRVKSDDEMRLEIAKYFMKIRLKSMDKIGVSRENIAIAVKPDYELIADMSVRRATLMIDSKRKNFKA